MSKLICVVALLCIGSCLSAQTVSLKLFVGTMGRSDEAECFRLLLSEDAEKAGFIGVDRPEAADVILTGALSVRVYADYSQAQATVQLKAPDGERIWGRDFPPHHWPLGRDTVTLLAEDVIRGMMRDFRRSGKMKNGQQGSHPTPR